MVLPLLHLIHYHYQRVSQLLWNVIKKAYFHHSFLLIHLLFQQNSYYLLVFHYYSIIIKTKYSDYILILLWITHCIHNTQITIDCFFYVIFSIVQTTSKIRKETTNTIPWRSSNNNWIVFLVNTFKSPSAKISWTSRVKRFFERSLLYRNK